MDDMELSMRTTAEEYLKNAEYARDELEKLAKIRYKNRDEKKRKILLEEIYFESIEQYNELSEIIKMRK